ncbi:MAG: hypothetical protein A7316_00575 [Candidatus Altiarchaeales archaeon WOR_SM1_86-2]|nr:MAG: hypothetical protein A7316_00575 [Candidatus Altiarchaeales archaeon WOR_SM1_86-2]ODS41771.1 MAG: hypothetical protein A7315_00210 [Candidatus Altiarchaeales archaeon WOR_SM1_79]
MKKTKILILIGISVMVLLSGCIEEKIQNTQANKTYERIISTSPSNTEILFALGLEDKVIGVTTYCNYPEEAEEKEKIGGFSTVDIELIINSTPDLVLASSMMKDEDIKKLEGTGIEVVVIDPENIDEILENIELIGNLTGKEKEALNIAENLEKRINKVKENAENLKKKPKVMYVVWHEPLMSAGRKTFANDLIEIAGGENIYSDTEVQYPTISLESVIDRNPDIIITSMGHGDAKNLTYEYIMNEPRLKNVNAVKNGRVYGIDTDLTGRPGPRIIDGLERFAEWIQE